MKLLFFTLVIALTLQLKAQNGAALNYTGALADPSAMLDISSSNSGLLIPRMTEIQKNSIVNPAIGLLVYQTDALTGFWYYDGNAWIQSIGIAGVDGPTGPTGPSGVDGSPGLPGILPAGTAVGNTTYWDGSQWVVNSSNIYNNGNQVGIGTSMPDASAGLHLGFTDKGLLIPRVSLVERNSINSPAEGLIIYNTDCFNINVFRNGVWDFVHSGVGPSAPTTGVHASSVNQIVWNWNAVQGVAGYKYSTVNNYAGAIDNGTSTSFTQSGLASQTTYTLYVWAYSVCGNSQVAVLSQTTLLNCGFDAVTFVYKGTNTTYQTVIGLSGSCWLDRNLGATGIPTAHNHSVGFGDLFQWGRADDGHQTRTSATTTTLSSNPTVGHNRFIINSGNWYSGSNPDSLWQFFSGINNPCPPGWRIPTYTELNAEYLLISPSNYTGGYAAPQKWTTAGWRNNADASVALTGSYGYYWSSTVSGTSVRVLDFLYNEIKWITIGRGSGRSVRCIID